jgi:hypothetical protein
MGAIARSAANLITTSGVVLKGAVNNDSFDNVTALPSSFGDGITLISSQTASASATISFTTGIDSTYKAYKFVFVNIHPATDATILQFFKAQQMVVVTITQLKHLRILELIMQKMVVLQLYNIVQFLTKHKEQLFNH